jgi:hypothetical protein
MLIRQKPVFSILENPELGTKIAALGVQQEIGTINDQLSRYLFDAATGKQIPTDALRSEIVRSNGSIGVRIWSEGVESFDLRIRGLRALINPAFSMKPDGDQPDFFVPPTMLTISSQAAS